MSGRTDRDKRGLAGDVAALANTAGGIIILGVAEDDQAQAAAAPGVAISDDAVCRMRQVIASLVAPMPEIDILPVPASPGGDHGFLIVAVLPSPSRPHAVLVNVGMRFPVRNGKRSATCPSPRSPRHTGIASPEPGPRTSAPRCRRGDLDHRG
ncbi:MAG TPA: ATP-binding protein [Streptosporangiaceae bacterium]